MSHSINYIYKNNNYKENIYEKQMLRYTYLDEIGVNDSEFAYLLRSSISTCFTLIQIIFDPASWRRATMDA